MATTLSKTLTRLHAHRCCASSSSRLLTSLPNHSWIRHASSSAAVAGAAASFSSSAALETRPSSSAPAQENKKGSKWSKLILFLPGAITFGLGTWQIVRRQDKIKTLDYRQQRLKMEPMKLNTEYPSGEDLDSLEFRRVVCKGVFDEGRSIYVGPRSRAISGVTENGYYVITPLMAIPNNPDSVQSPILVNRGWVPRSWKEKSSEPTDNETKQLPNTKPHSVQSSEQKSWWKFWSKKMPVTSEDQSSPALTPVQVVGVIRGSEKPTIFVPANDPNSSQWFYVDVPATARALGLPENTIYVEDINENINPTNPYPVPKDVNTLIRSSVMPQDHLNYTLTWYSLSAAVTFMAYKRLKPKGSRR